MNADILRYPAYGEWIHVHPKSVILNRFREEKQYEAANINIIKNMIPRDGCFYDVGANYGFISLAAAVSRPDIRILSIEPSTACVEAIRRTIQAMHDPQWSVISCAVGEQTGRVDFITSSAGDDAYGGLVDTGRVSRGKYQEQVDCRTLDEIWKERDRECVSLIKIDVEGMESSVLRGSLELINEHKPIILLEISRSNLKRIEYQADEYLEQCVAMNYCLLNARTMGRIEDACSLELNMCISEDFLLVPGR